MWISVPTPEMYNGDFSNWVDSQGRMIVIYDPATTRPNPNGTGFIRDPFSGNRIPVERFSTVAKQYIGMARTAVVPNRAGLGPGTFGYVSNNFLSPGGTTVETTHKLSVKIDHALSGAHVSIPHIQGSDWFQDPEPSSALIAYAPPSEYEIRGQLRAQGLSLRLDFVARAPQITLLGFEDALGHLVPTPALTAEVQDGVVRALEEQLLLLRR